jgi:hypothetical protein
MISAAIRGALCALPSYCAEAIEVALGAAACRRA